MIAIMPIYIHISVTRVHGEARVLCVPKHAIEATGGRFYVFHRQTERVMFKVFRDVYKCDVFFDVCGKG